MDSLPVELLVVVVGWVPEPSHALAELVCRAWCAEVRRLRKDVPSRAGPWLYAGSPALYRLHVFSKTPETHLARPQYAMKGSIHGRNTAHTLEWGGNLCADRATKKLHDLA
jgi:hypothetical protein